MAGEKNFNIKNGLSVGGVEVIDSNGDIVAAGVGTAVNEAIADKIGGIISGTGGATATYNDGADTIVIDVPITDEDDMSSNSATAIPSQQSVKAYVDSQVASKDALSELSGDTDDVTEGSSNLYFTNARADARITAALIDEDDMSSNSATRLPSQQSVKAYVDSQVDTADHLSELGGTTDNLTEGSSNLFHTTERVQDVVGGQLVTNGSHTGVSFAYDDSGDGGIDATVSLSGFSTSNLSEGSNQYHTTERVQDVVGGQLVTNGSHTNITASYDDSGDGAIDLSISDADIRGKISVTDSGGDGSLAYNNSTGVLTYTGITDAQ